MTARILCLLLLLMAPGAWGDELPAPGGTLAAVTLDDAAGKPVDTARFAGRPLVLVPVYFRCPNICLMSMAHLLDLTTAAGRDVEVSAVSFDPEEGPADAQAFAAQVLRDHPAVNPAHLHFLTGMEGAALLQGIGFTARRAGGEFVHPAMAAVVDPDLKVAAWISTIAATPATFTAALDAAAASRRLTLSDFVLTCVHALTGTPGHDAAVLLALKIAGCLTVLALAGAVVILRKAWS